jgi:Na+/H+ antiporter NhaC
MDNYGILTLFPLILMLVMVIATKRIFESMLIPLILVFIMKDGSNFLFGFIDSIYATFAEETYPWILLMLTLFGAFISLLIHSGGTNGFRKFAVRYIQSQKSSLVFTWILGVVLFIDDYINNLGIGPTVRDITDKYQVPREGLGFIICSMGTPICSLVPLTAFAVFVFGLMQDFGISPEGSNLLTEYLKLVPFMFYPMLVILVSFLLVVGIAPRIGPLKRHFQELSSGSAPCLNDSPYSEEYALDTSDGKNIAETSIEKEESSEGNILDFLLPIGIVLLVMLSTSDLVFSVILGLASCFILYIPRKVMGIDKFFSSIFSGINDMIYILIIILMTFVFVRGLNDIGFSDYVVTSISPFLNGGVIPALTFITVGIIAFLGVDYWAVMLLIAPIALPLSGQFEVNEYLTMAAIASGAIFGGTACFFSEQMLMCSQSVQRPPVRVALCGLPYSLTAFALASILYLVFGFLI